VENKDLSNIPENEEPEIKDKINEIKKPKIPKINGTVNLFSKELSPYNIPLSKIIIFYFHNLVNLSILYFLRIFQVFF